MLSGFGFTAGLANFKKTVAAVKTQRAPSSGSYGNIFAFTIYHSPAPESFVQAQ
jgi:hypothetical protein